MKITFMFTMLLACTSAFATETCRLKEIHGFHPSGAPYTRVHVNCSDIVLQNEIIFRFSDNQVGATPFFLGKSKRSIIQFIKSDGYTLVRNGLYQK